MHDLLERIGGPPAVLIPMKGGQPMVIEIPEGVYTMQTKRSIGKTNARQYRQ